MKDKIVSAGQAVRLIRDGDALCTSGFVGIGTILTIVTFVERAT